MTSSLLPTYARIELAFERGDGAWLTSTAGERFLDFGGGIAVASLGYGHPHLVAALNQQGAKIWHTSNLFEIPQAERLARRLVDKTDPRDVGAAVGRNPLSILIPCHRVVGSTGKLTGYAGGLTRKRALLDLEAGHPGLW